MPKKIAIVIDWLVVFSGAEQVLAEMIKCFPDADLFALVDFLPEEHRGFLQGKTIKTTFIQKLPFAKAKYRSYLPLMPLAVSRIDVSDYDLVISSSHAVAKAVKTRKEQCHICYIHTPMRYAWDLQEQYLTEAGFKGLKKYLAKFLLKRLQAWDKKTAVGVDYFIANSNYIAKRVHASYQRQADVIYPPVNVDKFLLQQTKGDFYVTASRLVPYKCIPLIVEAFAKMPNKKLIVIGDGPDRVKIEKNLPSNVELLGYQSDEVLKDHLQRAKAFVYAAIEDFGILPVEAQACGTPVIAYGTGGLTETIVANKTGLFYDELVSDAIVAAVKKFETLQFDAVVCRENAKRFSADRFKDSFKNYVINIYQGQDNDTKG